MGRVAIIEPAITQLVAEARDKVAELQEAEEACRKLEKKLGEGREAAQMRRLELGTLLLKVRAMYPRRGTKEDGWKAYLEAIEVDDSTAHRYMEMARSPAATSQTPDVRSSEGPIPPDDDAPPRHEDEGGPELARDHGPPVGVDEPEIDRDTWCTPKWITEALGQVDLDPCANERSHVQAAKSFDLERRGEDGLELAKKVKRGSLTFINPPYSNVRPWIDAYGHVRFIFLLKFDPSTKWFVELMSKTRLVLIPKGTRVEFEAPPEVPPEKSGANPFPHALFFALAEDAPQALLDRCFAWRLEDQSAA